MEGKTIIRVQKGRSNPYVIIDKRIFSDGRLSWKAKGILGYLLSKPDNWKVMIVDLIKQSKDGRIAVYSGLKELEDYGYLKREPIRDEKKRIMYWEYTVYEQPQKPQAEEEPEKPCATSSCRFPESRFSTYGINAPTDNDLSKNESTNNKNIRDFPSGKSRTYSFDEYLSVVNNEVDEEKMEAVRYYLKKYREERGEEHPRMTAAQWERVFDRIFYVEDENTGGREFPVDYDDVVEMIDQHFCTRYQDGCDYHLLHFVSKGIMMRRFYEAVY